MNQICTGMESKLAELLLDPEAVPAKVRLHVEGCENCRQEIQELQAAMGLLDCWQAPEPNPYFLARMHARLKQERAAPRLGWLGGWLERWRAQATYGSGAHVRPLAAMALTVMLLVGGGAYLGVTDWDAPPIAPGQAAVVHDLQNLDQNAQLLDQLEALSSTNSSGN